jgi:hypothetical protein
MELNARDFTAAPGASRALPVFPVPDGWYFACSSTTLSVVAPDITVTGDLLWQMARPAGGLVSPAQTSSESAKTLRKYLFFFSRHEVLSVLPGMFQVFSMRTLPSIYELNALSHLALIVSPSSLSQCGRAEGKHGEASVSPAAVCPAASPRGPHEPQSQPHPPALVALNVHQWGSAFLL